MTESEETAYVQGSRMTWIELLRLCCQRLGYDDNLDAAKAAWIIERETAIRTLRSACRIYGDNDWPDDLNLSDIIDNHLVDYLDEVDQSKYKWTDELPLDEGYYWIETKRHGEHVIAELIDTFEGIFFRWDKGQLTPDGISRYAGPIERPDEPESTEVN